MSFSPLWLVLCVLTISDASAAGTTPSVRLAKLQSWPLTPLTKFANLFVKRYGMQRIIDGPIRLMDGTTVEVADSPMSDKDGGYFLRYLFSGDNVVASMRLETPVPLESSQLDSTKWKLNYKILDFTHYATTMIEEMFTYGVAKISKDAAAKVLSIGLGSGYINSYLHSNYRNVNITVVEIDKVMLNISKKWFGLELDNRHKVIIADGVGFVINAETIGSKYDVIYLDACTMEESVSLNCPFSTFLAPKVVRSFARLLSRKGILVINVMTFTSDHIAAAKSVKKAFEKSFEYCVGKVAPFSPESIVMTCAQFKPPWGLKDKYQRWQGYKTKEEWIEL